MGTIRAFLTPLLPFFAEYVAIARDRWHASGRRGRFASLARDAST
jgi:hypothetical protein